MSLGLNLDAVRPPWHGLVEENVQAAECELVQAELRGQGAGRVLRVLVDRPGGVGLEDCERVSRAVSAALDAAEAGGTTVVPGSYTLEVSSPGWDRPLVRRADFDRFAGQRIRLTTRQPIAGRRNFTGQLVGAEPEGVRLELEPGTQTVVAWGEVDNAHLAPLPPAVAGKPKGPRPKARKEA